jgi:hypothetical protein
VQWKPHFTYRGSWNVHSLHSPNPSPMFNKIWYRAGPQEINAWLWSSRKPALWEPQFTDRNKWIPITTAHTVPNMSNSGQEITVCSCQAFVSLMKTHAGTYCVYTNAFTYEPMRYLEATNTLVNSVYYATQYTICNLVVLHLWILRVTELFYSFFHYSFIHSFIHLYLFIHHWYIITGYRNCQHYIVLKIA